MHILTKGKTLDDYVREAVPALDGCLVWMHHPSKTKAVAKVGTLPKLILERKLGRKLKPGEVTRHICDVQRCLNKHHVIVGTQGDNNRDTARRRRGNPPTKLSAALRVEIGNRYLFGGITQAELAAEYGVSQVMISQCARRLCKNPKWDGVVDALSQAKGVRACRF